MAITDINISEQLQTDAPSIKYTGNEGPQNPQQQQQEMQIAQQIWEALGPEQQSQFQSFEQFFQSGIWKQILQQMQADEAQGQEQQGIGSLGPNQGSPSIMERATTDTEVEDAYGVPVGAAHGGRIGYRYGRNYKSNQGSSEMKFNMDAKIKYLRERGASDEEIYEIIVLGKDMSDRNLYEFEKSNQEKEQFERELEGERRAEPFYPDRFEGERRAEPFYPDRFEGRLEPMAHGGRIGIETLRGRR